MKLLHDTEEATHNRKIMKSQVEKRRRERMNDSLERLRTMLLQEQQPLGTSQHKLEKAEILEHTVLFLQSTARSDHSRAGGGGGQKPPYQDGFSTCLQTAAQFLGPEGKGLWLGAALDATTAACSNSDSAPSPVRTEAHSSTSPPPRKSSWSVLQMLKRRSRHRLHISDANTSVHAQRLPHQHRDLPIHQQPEGHNHLEIRVERPAGKQSEAQSLQGSQSLWRPWP
ncbi:uncharacterized protein LOC143000976 [Genypterus blacodes]|uniref:uncharacterized protein LOC143000976 n=1 Tax=Genypterus blacodes TaxID=154954 RepID=UPI003F7629C2